MDNNQDVILEETIDTNNEKSKGKGFAREALSFLATTAVFVLIFILIVQFVARPVIVQGSSMESTCYNGDYMIIWQLGYNPQRGDIVVTDEDNLLKERLVKRVIATGGDKIEIKDGILTINGEVQTEDYIKDQNWGSDTYFDDVVPEGSVFVMGDNRNDSTDSRYLGYINNDSIMGKVVVRLFPFDKIGGV